MNWYFYTPDEKLIIREEWN